MLSHFIQSAGVSPSWLAVAAVGVAVVSYFLGCFNGAVVVSHYVLRNDVRNHGSGNAGLTNFYRTFGGPLTAVVILSDVVKALLAMAFAVFLAWQMSPELVTLSKYWAGAFCLLGHMYPCMFQFKGGKGILSGGTIVLLMDWRIALVAWGGFLILVVVTRYVSLGSCWAALSFPFMSGIVYQDVLITLLAVLIGGLILWKHRMNMVRIVTGTEPRFTLRKHDSEGETVTQQRGAGKADAEEGSKEAAEEIVREDPHGEASDDQLSVDETQEEAKA